MSARPEAVTMNVRQRTQSLLSPVNLHWAGVGLLALVNLYLLVHLAILWQHANAQSPEAVARQEVALKTAQIAARPLAGLDTKLHAANADADTFYLERLPVSYSEVAAELGTLARRTNTRLTRVQYAQSAVAGDAAGQLTQVVMDASLSGDYRSLVTFINALERDRSFFLINGVALTGQQTGVVNLRLRMTTYLHGAPADLPPTVAPAADASPAAAGGVQ